MPTAESASIRLHYELSGRAGGEVLALANALGSSFRMWDRVLPAFEKSYRVLRYDMRGHGKSSVPPGPYSIGQLGDDLLFLLDTLGLARVNLCGLSLGGLVAMKIGIAAPGRVNRIILANTVARFGSRPAWEQRISEVRASGMLPIASGAIERWFTPAYRDQHAEEMQFIREMIAATPADGYAACCGVLRDTDLSGEVRSIGARCLVIAGTRDPATTPEDGRALQMGLRNSRYVELDASHLSAWERPDEFAATVTSFLEREEHGHG